MGSALRQVAQISLMNLRALPQRPGASLVIVAGVAGVVAVLVALLAMARGFEYTLASTGRPDRVIMLRAGSVDELSSVMPPEMPSIVRSLPGIRRGADGEPLIVAERYLLTRLTKQGSKGRANVAVRGTSIGALRVRPEVRLVAGRMFSPGLREVIAGRGAVAQYGDLVVGAEVPIRNGSWTIVGIFESGGDVHESELWVDDSALRDAMRSSFYTTLVAQLEDDASTTLETFRRTLADDPRIKAAAQREPDYYSSRSIGLHRLVTILGHTVAVIMGLGALFGALNTMYAAVAARSVEIGTLRALGFTKGVVVATVMTEALLLSLGGAVIGTVAAYAAFNGLTVSTINFQTFSQVAFAFAVEPGILIQGAAYALVIGFFGGLAPAMYAAQKPIIEALRDS